MDLIDRLKLITWGIDHYVMSEAGVLLLFDAIDRIQSDLPIVEIGVYMGRTTRAMAMYCKATGKPNKIYGIDPFELFQNNSTPDAPNAVGIKEMTISNLSGWDNVEIIQGFSWDDEVLDMFPEVAMVFLDGDHTKEGVKRDLNNWMPRTKEFFIMHDMRYRTIYDALSELGIFFIEPIWNFGVIKGYEGIIEEGWFKDL